MEGLGSRLSLMLEKKEITQKEFAKKISVTPTALNNYIQGKREPEYNILVRICNELNCSADFLLGRPDPVPILPPEENDLLKAWRKADPDLKGLVNRALGVAQSKKKAS